MDDQTINIKAVNHLNENINEVTFVKIYNHYEHNLVMDLLTKFELKLPNDHDEETLNSFF